MATKQTVHCTAIVLASTLLLPLGAIGATPPTYAVTYLGTGAAADISDSGIVVGNTSAGPARAKTAWVWRNGARSVLPLPPGMSVSGAKAVNSDGVIVGYVAASPTAPALAVKWSPRGAAYAVAMILGPRGIPASVATDINDAGTIVGIAQTPARRVEIQGRKYTTGAKRAFRVKPGGSPEFLDSLGEFSYTFIDSVRSPQINAAGTVYNGVRTLVRADGSVQQIPPVAIGSGTYEFNGFINDAGEIGGHVGLTSSSMPSTMVGVKYSQRAGWSRYPHFAMPDGAFTALNARGDAAYYGGTYAPGPTIDYAGAGPFPPQHLLAPEFRQWRIAGGALLNDRGLVLTGGRNAATGQSGVVLLTPSGMLQSP